MYNRYLITGTTGFLGRTLVQTLIERGEKVSALVLPKDPMRRYLPEKAEIIFGDVCEEESLLPFFERADAGTCVIHCAGIVSIASHPDDRLYQVNVKGTRNVLRWCEGKQVGKLVYVSSVHAIPREKTGESVICERETFAPGRVSGDYAKSKAMATALVLEAAEQGLNASIVFPSGIIGPGDYGRGSITGMLNAFIHGKLPLAVEGGYDFVDVRDVANGIVQCALLGSQGEGYVLSGHYATIREILGNANLACHAKKKTIFLPLGIARIAAPLVEKHCLKKGEPLFFTPYSVDTLQEGIAFKRDVAVNVLGFLPRSVKSSVIDTVNWLIDRG